MNKTYKKKIKIKGFQEMTIIKNYPKINLQLIINYNNQILDLIKDYRVKEEEEEVGIETKQLLFKNHILINTGVLK